MRQYTQCRCSSLSDVPKMHVQRISFLWWLIPMWQRHFPISPSMMARHTSCVSLIRSITLPHSILCGWRVSMGTTTTARVQKTKKKRPKSSALLIKDKLDAPKRGRKRWRNDMRDVSADLPIIISYSSTMCHHDKATAVDSTALHWFQVDGFALIN